ncbi:MAG: hypothetical protein PCFJNLEI_04238 [Verrucomicrobiae bacterium]|nr:hypothetical protein [Verrucomicrobiae bacterium]
MRLILLALLATSVFADEALKITVSATGLQSLTYRGVEYCDPNGAGVLGFTGGAATMLDAEKKPGKFAEQPTSATVAGTTVTQTYPWGQLTVRYTVTGDDLKIEATLTNTSSQALSSWLGNLCQLNDRLKFDASGQNMHWDYQKDRWGGGSNPYLHWNFADPHVYWWNDGATKIIFVDLDPTWDTGVQRVKTPGGDRWVVTAGGAATVNVALRFRPVTANVLTEAADAYGAFGRANPLTHNWTDRRPIGTLFVAESAKGWPKNPNGWFNDEKLDVTTDEGRQEFAKWLLARVDACIAVLKENNAQGVIWWDIEGARNPHPITYIGDPRVLDPQHPQHDKYAPEMDTPVTSNGKTMPVVDACFAKFRDAGFKTGITIRPQVLTWKGNAPIQAGTSKPNDETLPKVEYARHRWDCRLFYVDSVTDWFACWWYDAVTKKYPDTLLMPEWARTRTFWNAAPFSYTKFTGWTRGAPPVVKACWPNAFCAMSNVDFDNPRARVDALSAVQQGNILLFNCWYNPGKYIKAIYDLAGTKHTPVALDGEEHAISGAPTRVTLRATDEDNEEVRFSLLEAPQHGKLDKLDPKTGTVTYRPAAGFTGIDSFTFKATDPSGLDSNRGTIQIHIEETLK